MSPTLTLAGWFS